MPKLDVQKLTATIHILGRERTVEWDGATLRLSITLDSYDHAGQVLAELEKMSPPDPPSAPSLAEILKQVAAQPEEARQLFVKRVAQAVLGPSMPRATKNPDQRTPSGSHTSAENVQTGGIRPEDHEQSTQDEIAAENAAERAAIMAVEAEADAAHGKDSARDKEEGARNVQTSRVTTQDPPVVGRAPSSAETLRAATQTAQAQHPGPSAEQKVLWNREPGTRTRVAAHTGRTVEPDAATTPYVPAVVEPRGRKPERHDPVSADTDLDDMLGIQPAPAPTAPAPKRMGLDPAVARAAFDKKEAAAAAATATSEAAQIEPDETVAPGDVALDVPDGVPAAVMQAQLRDVFKWLHAKGYTEAKDIAAAAYALRDLIPSVKRTQGLESRAEQWLAAFVELAEAESELPR